LRESFCDLPEQRGFLGTGDRDRRAVGKGLLEQLKVEAAELVGLRDPYELLDLTGVRTYIAALGYAPVCAQAAVEVLFGETAPSGRMPVNV